MPEELAQEFGLREPEPRKRASLVEWASLAAMFMLLLAMLGVFAFLRGASNYQADAEQRGYKNRAAICEIQRDLGVELDKVCLDANVVAYYDPEAKHTANGAVIREMMCRLLDQLEVQQPNRAADCAGVDQ